ncbi:MAG: TlpA disulfide reductase family protein [Lapillicoccus sp.]
MTGTPRWGAAAVAVVAAAVVPMAGCSAGALEAVDQTTTATTATAVPASSPAYPLGVTEYPVAQRSPVPTLTGPTLSGAQLSTASLRGHVVVLTVWASWCDPCRTELPALAALARQQGGDAVRFVGLDEHDTVDAATSAVRSAGSDYPHLVDDGALLAHLSRWLPDAVPGSVVVDAEGRVAARVVGVVTAVQLRGVLDRARVS